MVLISNSPSFFPSFFLGNDSTSDIPTETTVDVLFGMCYTESRQMNLLISCVNRQSRIGVTSSQRGDLNLREKHVGTTYTSHRLPKDARQVSEPQYIVEHLFHLSKKKFDCYVNYFLVVYRVRNINSSKYKSNLLCPQCIGLPSDR